MPGMAFEDARRRMVAGNGENVWFFSKEDWERGIQFRNRIAFAGEVAVLALHVGVFEMDEEEIVVGMFGEIALELLGDGLRPFQPGHADELRQAFVHGIDGEATSPQAVAIGEGRNGGLMGNSSEQKAIRW